MVLLYLYAMEILRPISVVSWRVNEHWLDCSWQNKMNYQSSNEHDIGCQIIIFLKLWGTFDLTSRDQWCRVYIRDTWWKVLSPTINCPQVIYDHHQRHLVKIVCSNRQVILTQIPSAFNYQMHIQQVSSEFFNFHGIQHLTLACTVANWTLEV